MLNIYKISAILLFLCVTGLTAHRFFISADNTSLLSTQSYIDTAVYQQDMFDRHNVKVINNPDTEIQFPHRAQPDETQSVTDLSYWISTLPFAQDKAREGYIVYPKHGIITPISTPSNTDQKKIKQGKGFDHYPYLEDGALYYRGTHPHNGDGNMVIAAHSSFHKNDPGRYKTVFQTLPISSIGDKVFVYRKNQTGSYDLYTYAITNSFETTPQNTKILAQTKTPTLTTYGCYAIGSNSDRWVNQARLISTTKNHAYLEENQVTKSQVQEALQAIPTQPDTGDKNKVQNTSAISVVTYPPNNTFPEKTKNIDTSISIPTSHNTAPSSDLISEDLDRQIKVLVGLIHTRLSVQPHLSKRVESRLSKKVTTLQDLVSETSSKSSKKTLAVYERIAHYYYTQYSK